MATSNLSTVLKFEMDVVSVSVRAAQMIGIMTIPFLVLAAFLSFCSPLAPHIVGTYPAQANPPGVSVEASTASSELAVYTSPQVVLILTSSGSRQLLSPATAETALGGPTPIETVSDLIARIDSWGGSSQIAAGRTGNTAMDAYAADYAAFQGSGGAFMAWATRQAEVLTLGVLGLMLLVFLTSFYLRREPRIRARLAPKAGMEGRHDRQGRRDMERGPRGVRIPPDLAGRPA